MKEEYRSCNDTFGNLMVDRLLVTTRVVDASRG